MATTTAPASGAGYPPDLRPVSERANLGWLLALAVLTRLPLLSNAPAEPDSLRFLMGVWHWLRWGPRVTNLYAAVHGAIYGDFLSPGYYALAVGLVRLLRLTPAHFALLLNLLSLGASLAAVPLLYRLARLLVDRATATAATALFLIAPGYWWLAIEPHPQGLAITFFLAGVLACARAWARVGAEGHAGSLEPPRAAAGRQAGVRAHQWLLAFAVLYSTTAGRQAGVRARQWLWLALGALLLLASFLMRADYVLYVGALPVLYWICADPAGTLTPWRAPRLALRALLEGGGVAALAGGAFLGLRSYLLERPLRALESQSTAVSGGYIAHGWLLLHQQLGYLVRQLLPFVFALGPWVFLWMAAGVWMWLRRGPRALMGAGPRVRSGRWRPLLFAAAWSGPGAVFWFLVLGNTPRHVVLLGLPWLWLGALGWQQMRSRPLPVLAVGAALAVALNWATIPPNSNLTLVPSPNVPGSARLLRNDLARAQRASVRLLAATYALGPGRGPMCYFGTETDQMIEWDLVRRFPNSLRFGPDTAAGASTVAGLGPAAAPLWFYETYTSMDYRKQQPGCAASSSLEVGPQKQNMFVGSEWLDAMHAWGHRLLHGRGAQTRG